MEAFLQYITLVTLVPLGSQRLYSIHIGAIYSNDLSPTMVKAWFTWALDGNLRIVLNVLTA